MTGTCTIDNEWMLRSTQEKSHFPATTARLAVSYACSKSTAGIVHKPAINSLGASLPANAIRISPIPQNFLEYTWSTRSDRNWVQNKLILREEIKLRNTVSEPQKEVISQGSCLADLRSSLVSATNI